MKSYLVGAEQVERGSLTPYSAAWSSVDGLLAFHSF